MPMHDFMSRLSSDLLQYADRAGVRLDSANSLIIGRPEGFVVVAVEYAFHQRDPLSYQEGVVMGAGYLSANLLRRRSSDTFCVLRTQIDEPSIGIQRGSVELLSETMSVIGSIPARYNINSLTVPPTAKGIVRLTAARDIFLTNSRPDDVNDEDWCIGITWECDNGSDICIGFEFDPTPIDPPES